MVSHLCGERDNRASDVEGFAVGQRLGDVARVASSQASHYHQNLKDKNWFFPFAAELFFLHLPDRPRKEVELFFAPQRLSKQHIPDRQKISQIPQRQPAQGAGKAASSRVITLVEISVVDNRNDTIVRLSVEEVSGGQTS